MKKIITLCILLLGALGAQAQTAKGTFSYVYSSDFNQLRAGTSITLGTFTDIGVLGRYVKDKKSQTADGFKDPIFSVYLPLQMDLDLVTLSLTPFYYFKTDSPQTGFDDPYAYGITARLLMNLRMDETEELYTHAYLQAGFARQKGILQKKGEPADSANYSQLAYTLGIRQNFFSAFTFHTAATAYHYPQGISAVDNFRGVLDQNDLAFTQSYDISRSLGKYVVSARITRLWPEEHSSLYFGYHFAEFYTAAPQHSFLLGNSFYVTPAASIDAAYNHLQTTGGKNKRDIFYINLTTAF